MRRASSLALVAFVFGNVALQLVAAKLIKDAAAMPLSRPVALGGMLLVVLMLASFRFVIWGEMHKRYPFSLAYPASALFFPLVVGLAWMHGEAVTRWHAFGAGLVTLGVVLSILGHSDEVPDP